MTIGYLNGWVLDYVLQGHGFKFGRSHGDEKHYSHRETRQKQFRILGIQDALIPCRSKLLELCRRSTRNVTQPTTHRPSNLGGLCRSRESHVVLPCIMCSFPPRILRWETLFPPRNSIKIILHIGNTRCTNTLSVKAIRVMSKKHKKRNPTQHTLTIQLGRVMLKQQVAKKRNPTQDTPTIQLGRVMSKQRVTCCTALHHVFMITCSATFERPKHWRRCGGI